MEGIRTAIVDRPPVGGSVRAFVVALRESLAHSGIEAMDDHEQLALMAELERLKGSASACQMRATDAVRASREASANRDALRSVGSEVALARRESPSLGDRFVGVSRVGGGDAGDVGGADGR